VPPPQAWTPYVCSHSTASYRSLRAKRAPSAASCQISSCQGPSATGGLPWRGSALCERCYCVGHVLQQGAATVSTAALCLDVPPTCNPCEQIPLGRSPTSGHPHCSHPFPSPATESFVTCSAALELESYRYAFLAAASGREAGGELPQRLAKMERVTCVGAPPSTKPSPQTACRIAAGAAIQRWRAKRRRKARAGRVAGSAGRGRCRHLPAASCAQRGEQHGGDAAH
jgi:hypothetical protein